MKTRYRNKLGKIIVEVEVNNKWRYVKTLKSPDIEFSKECLEKCLSYAHETNIETKKDSPKGRLININRTTEKDTNMLKAMQEIQDKALKFELPVKKELTQEEKDSISKL